MQRFNLFFVIFSLVFITIGCSKDGDTTNKEADEVHNQSGFLKATITYSSGESFTFNGMGNIIWEEIQETGGFQLTMDAEDHNLKYQAYQAAVFHIKLAHINEAGTYAINIDSPHVNDKYSVSFSNLLASSHSPLAFYLGSGEIKIDRLDSQRSTGSFEFELILAELPEGTPYPHDNPNGVQSITVTGTYDNHVLTN